MKTALIIIIVIAVIGAIYMVFFNPINHLIEKLTFYRRCASKIYKTAKNGDYYLLNKVAVQVGNKTIHFDHLVFTEKYIFCIVDRYFPVGISANGDDSSAFIYNTRGKVEIIKNPLSVNRERVNYFSSLISSHKDIFYSVVVVNDSAVIESTSSDHDILMNISSLEGFISKCEKNTDVSKIDEEKLYNLVQDIYRKCTSQGK